MNTHMKEMNMNELEQVNGGDGFFESLSRKIMEAIEEFKRRKGQFLPKA